MLLSPSDPKKALLQKRQKRLLQSPDDPKKTREGRLPTSQN